MDSSFLTMNGMSVSPTTWSMLTTVNIALGLYTVVMFIKLIIQFGVPNHPIRLTAYFVTLCTSIFFVFHALVGMNLIAPWFWLKYRPLPMVAGSLALLLQVIMSGGSFTLIQQKVVSRIPLIGGLLVLAFFPTEAEIFVGIAILAGCIFYAFSNKARYQKRALFKLALFMLLYFGLRLINQYWVLVMGELLLFFALFYLFIFEQAFAVSALVDDHQNKETV